MTSRQPSTGNPYYIFTDFGAESIYVGQMKSVIKSIDPSGDLVTLSSTVPRQNPVAAAFLLKNSLQYIPEGANILCVIDPGVGTRRPIVLLRTSSRNHTLIGPDNGMFGFLKQSVTACRHVQNEKFMLDTISNTFHGRDIMAPVLAHVATSGSLQEAGPKHKSLKQLQNPYLLKARHKEGVLEGNIVYIDGFGNLITNISSRQIQDLPGEYLRKSIEINTDRVILDEISQSYSDVEPGTPLALIGSSGFLEISVNQGSAKQMYNMSSGDRVRVASRE